MTLKLLLTKPEDGVKNKEGSLRISVQPVRLNIDQDALFFVKKFFTELSHDNLGKIPVAAPDGMSSYLHFSLLCQFTGSL